MTPEERFTKIENAIQSLIETQGRHDTQLGDLISQVEKQNTGIQGLIAISHTTLSAITESRESIEKLRDSVEKLREGQQATDDKLHALIETVDRIIRQKN